jgi:hypothetical protein
MIAQTTEELESDSVRLLGIESKEASEISNVVSTAV